MHSLRLCRSLGSFFLRGRRESAYYNKIAEARTVECSHIQRFRALQVITIGLGRASPAVSSAAAIVAYALQGEPLDAGRIFATVSVFQSLRLALIVFPHALTAIATIRTTLGRVETFLLVPDKDHAYQPTTTEGAMLELHAVDVGHPPDEAVLSNIADAHNAISTLAATNVLNPEEAADLEARATSHLATVCVGDVSLVVAPRRITAVIGGVGAGKSTLLQTVVGELSPLRGQVQLRDGTTIGYVPQQAIIISGTIRENILFGRELSTHALNRALQRSDFVFDIKLFEHGLETEVGERGTTLSGGQQQRLSIARALYGDPELLVLDDPLSAVDPEVCRRIFDRAVRGFADEGGAVLMACNQIHLLSQCHDIVVLDGGKVAEHGAYDHLMANGAAFRDLIDKHVHDSADETGTTPAGDEATKADAAEEVVVADKAAVRADETVKTGSMKANVYFGYVKGMGLGLWGVTLLCVAIGYATMVFMDYWLASWVEDVTADEYRYPEDTYIYVYIGVGVPVSPPHFLSIDFFVLTCLKFLCP